MRFTSCLPPGAAGVVVSFHWNLLSLIAAVYRATFVDLAAGSDGAVDCVAVQRKCVN